MTPLGHDRRPKKQQHDYHTLGLVVCIVVGLISQASLISRVMGRQAGKMLSTRLECSLDQILPTASRFRAPS
jgi:hypothetical protein